MWTGGRRAVAATVRPVCLGKARPHSRSSRCTRLGSKHFQGPACVCGCAACVSVAGAGESASARMELRQAAHRVLHPPAIVSCHPLPRLSIGRVVADHWHQRCAAKALRAPCSTSVRSGPGKLSVLPAHVHSHSHTHTCIHIHIHMHTHTCARTHIHAQVCANTRTCMHRYALCRTGWTTSRCAPAWWPLRRPRCHPRVKRSPQ